MPSIWERWEAHYKQSGIDPRAICKDGILNEALFATTRPKVLFLMKDVNHWPGGDLRDLLRDGPKYQMWHTVARWSAGILGDFPPYDAVNVPSVMAGALSRIATINLKKTTGGSSADMRVINAYTHQDESLLREQVDSINPNMIIACGTIDAVLWLLDVKVHPDKPWEERVLQARTPNCRVIPWRHPARADNRKTYAALKRLLANSSES